jgi:hypothetical protein
MQSCQPEKNTPKNSFYNEDSRAVYTQEGYATRKNGGNQETLLDPTIKNA